MCCGCGGDDIRPPPGRVSTTLSHYESGKSDPLVQVLERIFPETTDGWRESQFVIHSTILDPLLDSLGTRDEFD